MSSSPRPERSTENKVLAAFKRSASQDFFSQLKRVSVSQGQVIYQPDAQIEYVYFPETAVFSMLTTMENSDTVEVGPVGDEGMVGLSIFFGATQSPTQVLAHVAGTAMRLRAEVLSAELLTERSVMPGLLLRYTQMLLAMTGQGAACNKLHTLEQQLARWLMMMYDYVQGELLLTHELIALTLGVRRAGITSAANKLKDAGVIEYRRGHIQIVDREGVKARACECYEVIKGEYDRLYADLTEFRI